MSRITVIVPVYKVEAYLKRCVDSLLCQTYEDFFLLLVDDGSPDRCGEICDAYMREDARVNVLHQKNAGLSAARNAGIEWALSRDDVEWISFVDSDDWVQPVYLEKLLEAAEENGADMAIGGYALTRGEALPSWKDSAVSLWKPEDYYLYDTLNAVVSWGKLYKKQLFRKVRFPVGKLHEDEFVFYQILFQCGFIPVEAQPLYAYFQNPDGISKGKWTPNHLDRLEAFEMQIQFFLQGEMRETARKRMFALIRNNLRSQEKIRQSDELTEKEKKYYISGCKEQLRRVLIRYRKTGWFHFHDSDWHKSVYTNAFTSIHLARSGWGSLKAALKTVPIVRPMGHQCLRAWRGRKAVPILIRYAACASSHQAILLQSPLHGNLGDHAIALSEAAVLRNQEISFADFPWTEGIERYCAKLTPGNRIIFQHGGGNLGQLWPDEEARFRASLKAFRHNRIVVFPQTVFFDMESEEGIRFFQESKEIYESHPDLILFVREKYSYAFMKKYMPKVHVEMVPDMAMILDGTAVNRTRSGALLCMRQDREKTISEENLAYMESCMREHFYSVRKTDTVLHEKVDPENREAALRGKLTEFSAASLVVTDRLHGMIFAAITETPCIVLTSQSHKVKGCYEWLKDLDYIRIIEEIRELPAVIRELQAVKPTYRSGDIEKAMEPLYEEIRAIKKKTRNAVSEIRS